MQIRVEFLGLTTLSKALGKSITVDMPEGSPVSDLVPYLVARYGKKVSSALMDASQEVDETIQIIINDEGFLNRDLWKRRILHPEDTVKLMLLVGGG